MISMGMVKVRMMRNFREVESDDFPLKTTSGTMSMTGLESLCGRGRKLTTSVHRVSEIYFVILTVRILECCA